MVEMGLRMQARRREFQWLNNPRGPGEDEATGLYDVRDVDHSLRPGMSLPMDEASHISTG